MSDIDEWEIAETNELADMEICELKIELDKYKAYSKLLVEGLNRIKHSDRIDIPCPDGIPNCAVRHFRLGRFSEEAIQIVTLANKIFGEKK